MNTIPLTIGIAFSAAFRLAVGWFAVCSLTSCESNKDSEFPKLTESEKQAFKLMNP